MTNKIPGGTLKGKLVSDARFRAANAGASMPKPGSFAFRISKRGLAPLFSYSCPCGCGMMSQISLFLKDDPKPAPRTWEWDGNREEPTLKPSILRYGWKDGASVEHWHGFIEKGVWRDA